MQDKVSPEKAAADERREYISSELRRSALESDPLAQFVVWLGQARDAKLIDATAMALSTVDGNGQPHSRMVLLKNCDASGFSFYSNYESDKGVQLDANPGAALLFYWRELERQVRIEGRVSKLPGSNADDYFYSRPEGSRFSAAVSAQSASVANRAVLEEAVAARRNEHPDGNVPRPANWGGYVLAPVRLEFWQGRADRLHDRFIYVLQADTSWSVERLAP